MVDFARPVSAMSKPTLGDLSPTSDPTGGKGFALDEAGKIPLIQATGETWRVEMVSSTINPNDLSDHSAQNNTVTISGLLVGDYCFWIGCDDLTASASNNFFCRPPICSVAGQITLLQFNADDTNANVASGLHYFLVLHRVT